MPLGAALQLGLTAPTWGQEVVLAHFKSTGLCLGERMLSQGTPAVGSVLPAPSRAHGSAPETSVVADLGGGWGQGQEWGTRARVQSALQPPHGAGQHEAAAR